MIVLDAYPLTAMQAGMIFHSTYQPETATYHDVFTLTLRGEYDPAALRTAIDEVVARHAILRTSFEIADLSEPLQVVHAEAATPIIETDLSAGGLDAGRQRLREWREQEKYRPFVLERAPLMRLYVHRLAADVFALTLSFHHAILDGWSAASMMTELLQRYSAARAGRRVPVTPPPLNFRDVVAAERTVTANPDATRYWRGLLADADLMRLPSLPGYPAGDSEDVASVAAGIAPEIVASLERVARRLRVPVRTVFLACHLRVLGLYAGTSDVVTGVVTHSRPEHTRGAELLGMFLNAVPMRVRVDAPTWERLIRDVFDAEAAMLPYRGYPLFELQRTTGRTTLFETIFDYRDFYAYDGLSEVQGLKILEYDYFDQTNIPLAAGVVRTAADGLPMVHLVYAKDRFPRQQMTAVLDAHLRAFADVAADPTIDPRDPTGLLGGDVALVESWQGVGPGGGVVAGSCDGLLGSGVGVSPGAWGLAERLRELGAGTDSRIGVCLSRDSGLVDALHAVVAVGGAYVPLEPEFPADRLRWMVADADAPVVVTTAGLAGVFAGLGVEVVVPDWSVAGPEVVAEVDDDALAYVIYTSGSTGHPKGVGVSRGAVTSRLEWMQRTFPLGADDVVLVKTPFSFDVSVWELFWPVRVGARQVVAPARLHRDPPALAAFIAEHGVTTVHFVPSMLSAFLDVPRLAELVSRRLKRVVCSGEALPPALVRRFFDLLPGVGLFNLYGPTEAAVDVSWRECHPGEDVIPIGRPAPGVRLEVLDARLSRMPVGVPGELCIGGIQVARGYLGSASLTAERFVPSPFDTGQRLYRTGDLARWLPTGELEYLGRIDDQVKIRGQRIEPGEIQTALARQPETNDAAVVVRPAPSGDPQLVAYVVPKPEALDEATTPDVVAEQVAEWSAMFDATYRDNKAEYAGYVSSYTGEQIPDDELREWVDHTVARIMAVQPSRVLELGCGNGLLLFPLARRVTAYRGMDIAEEALARVRRRLADEPMPHVTVARGGLDALSAVPPGWADTVVVNSVTQYFPDARYLTDVLHAAINATTTGGRIFLGDVRSLPLLTALHATAELHRAADTLETAELRRRLARRMSGERELVLAPTFFTDLVGHLPRLGRVEVALKRGTADNELTAFRYDVTLHLDTDPPGPVAATHRWANLDALRSALSTNPSDTYVVAGVPNRHLTTAGQLLALLSDRTGPSTAGGLRADMTSSIEGVPAEELYRLGDRLGYEVTVGYSADGGPTCCDAIFRRPGTPPVAMPVPGSATTANRPLLTRVAADLSRTWSRRLGEVLPAYMIPAAYLPLTELPLTANGKLDRAALPSPDAMRIEAPHEEPATETEQAVAAVWREVLGLARPSRRDNFFGVGGNSIRSLMLVARLRQAGYQLDGQLLFTHPVLADLAHQLADAGPPDAAPAGNQAADSSPPDDAFTLLSAADLALLNDEIVDGRR